MKKMTETSVCLSFCALLCLALFIGCSDKESGVAGATSETTNGIAVVVMDNAGQPLPQARITLFSKTDLAQIESAVSNDSGKVQFDSLALECLDGSCFVEGIAGADSSLMNWEAFEPTDSSAAEIELAPSASLTIRTGAAEDEKLFELLHLESTPYTAARYGSEYVFSHIPAGMFTVVADDSTVATLSLAAGVSTDTLMRIPELTREYVFEDFEDGDSLNNFAATHKNFGWYYVASGASSWVKPDTAEGFASAIEDGASGKILSMQFTQADSGYLLLGTHLGLDTGYYDLSALTAIRMKVRGDCELNIALEHYREVGDNTYRKALWTAQASQEWTEIVLRPGQEILNEENLQVPWAEISNEIGIFSIFVSSGTFLQIGEIVFEGIDSMDN